MKTPEVVAEIGVNHNGNIRNAMELIEVAADSGCDYVKFQNFQTDLVMSEKTPLVEYQKVNNLNTIKTQNDLVKNLELEYDDMIQVTKYAKKKGIQIFSSPFDVESLDFINNVLDFKIIKIASGEITHFPLLYEIGKSGKRLFLSTGASNITDIWRAISVLFAGSSRIHIKNDDHINELIKKFKSEILQFTKKNITIFHCTSSYPAFNHQLNMNSIDLLSKEFKTAIGYSDHSIGNLATIIAVTKNVSILERHITLSKNDHGPDHKLSLEPDELKAYIEVIKQTVTSLGKSIKEPSTEEIQLQSLIRRGVYAKSDIKVNDKYSEENLICLRPEINDLKWFDVVNGAALKNFKKGDPII
jgi:N,N'-diacetyllegionaminate synthase